METFGSCTVQFIFDVIELMNLDSKWLIELQHCHYLFPYALSKKKAMAVGGLKKKWYSGLKLTRLYLSSRARL